MVRYYKEHGDTYMTYINANGINTKSNGSLPELEEVQKCIKYLKNIKENEKYATNLTSYSLKRIIENEEVYVSNGAFIEALRILNLQYKRTSDDSLNVYVKFTREDLELIVLAERIKHLSLNQDLNQFSYCFDRSRTVGYRTNIKELQKFLEENLKVKFTREDIYIFLKSNQLMRFYYKDIISNDFLESMRVNISLQRLKKFLKLRNHIL